jgi:uncharacterized protein YxeA
LKKILFALIALAFIAGCSPEWYAHDTVYSTNDHMIYSLGGYKNTTPEDVKNSNDQGWWGEEIPYSSSK